MVASSRVSWHQRHADERTRGQRIADRTAQVLGSWPFIIAQTVIVGLWVLTNVTAWVQHWDPYPFILLNLMFSVQAAYAAPVIMMSQNWQAQRGRYQAQADYDTNVRAEREIEELQVQLRRITSLVVRLALGISLLALTGCTSPEGPEVSADETATTAAQVLEFGPVYMLGETGDPVVAKTLESVATTGAPVVSAEIRGYLVDWVHQDGDTTSIRELAVMKDGTLYTLSPYMRPAAGLEMQAPERLGPEPAPESASREAAVTAADTIVRQMYPDMSGDPVVYNYLIRIHLADDTSVDVWVDPDVGNGRLFYDIGLAQVHP